VLHPPDRYDVLALQVREPSESRYISVIQPLVIRRLRLEGAVREPLQGRGRAVREPFEAHLQASAGPALAGVPVERAVIESRCREPSERAAKRRPRLRSW
jgi:hypothetical protein